MTERCGLPCCSLHFRMTYNARAVERQRAVDAGMHGAALAWTLLMPEHAGMIELWPQEQEIWRCYEHTSHWSGLLYRHDPHIVIPTVAPGSQAVSHARVHHCSELALHTSAFSPVRLASVHSGQGPAVIFWYMQFDITLVLPPRWLEIIKMAPHHTQ